MIERYKKSEELIEQALRSIPLGTQTFSKSVTQFPRGVSPYFIHMAKGSHVWDIDDNEYIDFVNALGAITLGYNDPDVNQAVKDQFESGVLFSLPHPVELKVAEKIKELVPLAEMVRFGKNGSDATAGAVRLARAYTGRDHVVVCGYHGWQDWYIGSTSRHKGVPQAIRNLTHPFRFNDLGSLTKIFKKFPDGVACVIMEPMNIEEPTDNFLEKVIDLAHKNGSLVIFDETVTGFRLANGGAQEYFGVTPDLATFGKGMANGFPLAAIVGPGSIMKMMEEIFFSFTFGGETLSLAAALATLTKLQRKPVLKQISAQGSKIIEKVKERIKTNNLSNVLSISGHPAWTFLHFLDCPPYSLWQVKTLFLQEIFKRGILSIGTHNMCYAHSDKDIERLGEVYDEVFPILSGAIEERKLEEKLNCKPLEPLFVIR